VGKIIGYNKSKQNTKIRKKMEKKYKSIHNKIKKIANKTQLNKTKNAFHKHMENLTNVTFTEAEMQLLDKGLKYNLHNKRKG
jgi:hypothetical protein